MSTQLGPTLPPLEATSRHWDVVVVGAGPAGALAAYQLARQGMAVLLVDRARFPRWKVCGCCLTRQAQNMLATSGLGSLVGASGGIRLEGIQLAIGRHQAWLQLPGWTALSREKLDAALVQAAVNCGAEFLPQHHARLGPVGAGSRRLTLRHEDREIQVCAHLVLAADGLGGQFLNAAANIGQQVDQRSRIGVGTLASTAPTFYEAKKVYMACGKGGYLGMVRLEDGRLDLAAALDRQVVRDAGSPCHVASRLIREAGWPAIPELHHMPWRGTPPLTRSTRRLGDERLLVLGDAAGYVEPFTGEGITWALVSAVAVTPLAKRAIQEWNDSLVTEWTQIYRMTIVKRQRICRMLGQVLHHPKFVRALVTVLKRAPVFGTAVVRSIGGG